MIYAHRGAPGRDLVLADDHSDRARGRGDRRQTEGCVPTLRLHRVAPSGDRAWPGRHPRGRYVLARRGIRPANRKAVAVVCGPPDAAGRGRVKQVPSPRKQPEAAAASPLPAAWVTEPGGKMVLATFKLKSGKTSEKFWNIHFKNYLCMRFQPKLQKGQPFKNNSKKTTLFVLNKTKD